MFPIRIAASCRLLWSVVIILPLAACSEPAAGPVCTDDLRFQTTPAMQSLRVGDAFTPVAAAFTCGGAQLLAEVWVWKTADSTVASVDSLSGRITARSAGTTRVTPTGRRYSGGMPVTVVVQ